MSEEQQVATEVPGFNPPVGESLMGESQMGNAQRPQTPECLLLLLCLYMFVATNFLWYVPWYEWVWGDPTTCNVVFISWKYPVLLDIFTCGLL